MNFTVDRIAEMIKAEIVNKKELDIVDIKKIDDAAQNDITFLHNERYFSHIEKTNAQVIIVPEDFTTDKDICLLKVKEPYKAFLKILKEFYPVQPIVEKGINSLTFIHSTSAIGVNPSVGPFVSIGQDTRIGNNAQIQSNVTIGQNVKIGDNVIIYSNVSIRENCVIGDNVIIQNGVVIGSDGFGFAPGQSDYEKVPQVGNVILEDNVEIGANTVIDRATMGSTIIRRGTKLDNLIQIAHNVEIGKDVVIAAQTGIAGSTKVGDNCMFGGQVGVVGHITIGNRVMVGAQAGIAGNVKDGSIVTGTPARDMKKMRRIDASLGRIPDLIYTVKDIVKEVENINKDGKQ